VFHKRMYCDFCSIINHNMLQHCSKVYKYFQDEFCQIDNTAPTNACERDVQIVHSGVPHAKSNRDES
jgi:hypothetical protein